MSDLMHAVYLTTNGDTTTFLSTPLEVQGYGCGINELDGKVIIPKRLMKNKPKAIPSLQLQLVKKEKYPHMKS